MPSGPARTTDHWPARDAFEHATGLRDLPLVYDMSHNVAALEDHETGGRRRTLCVHRKGATVALPPSDRRLPAALRAVGQPVLEVVATCERAGLARRVSRLRPLGVVKG